MEWDWLLAVNRCVASRMLNKYGVLSETVDGGRKALERLGAGHNIDVVLMDIQMPEVRVLFQNLVSRIPHLACPSN